ncbi:hypothetical protein B0H19DRAFT_436698 [Mycena capillaripes]|nr:hypothetical protein B0H19DRAFT_436698 [Mycena capillaripes]
MDIPGRFGTIELLRQRPVSSANVSPSKKGDATETVVIASFGVDTPFVSFGRDTTCSVRLYYPAVAPLHARIVFNDDRKAFVEVLGAGGAVVDGCGVYPVGDSPGGGKKTVALANGSELEIHGKRFRFTYPPKDMRAALAASPARPANRALRLSMIASAQVFSPRPSHDPRQNLRVLQSPLRLASPSKSRSPSKSKLSSPSPTPRGRGAPAADAHSDEDEDGDEDVETITLVQGAHPRVVEEAKDLVILEDVEVAPGPAPSHARSKSITSGPSSPSNSSTSSLAPPAPPSAPRTPRRQSLHRAVLIRSAQRAVLAAHTPSTNSSAGSTPSNTSSANVSRGWNLPQTQTSPDKPARGLVISTQPPVLATGDNGDDSEEETDEEAEEAEVQRLGLEVLSVSSGSESEVRAFLVPFFAFALLPTSR